MHAAYLAVRLPATYAAVSAVLASVPEGLRTRVRSVLDLGAGPGTATWAALAACPSIVTATQVDRSQALLALGARLAAGAMEGQSVELTQRVADLAAGTWSAADLVIAAYALAELPAGARSSVVAAAWRATRELLVLVEPGTPAGFDHVHAARDLLISSGAHIVAPCPHEGTCPMRATPGAEDWCHLAVRVPRTRRHRQVKGGTLGYEDEKYAYLVATKDNAIERADARVLRHPRVEKGRIVLTLCTSDGARRQVVTRRDESWRAARKAEWGDAWG